MKLVIDWNEFENKMNDLAIGADVLLQSVVGNNDELEEFDESFKKWSSNCYDYLSTSFDKEDNKFANGFRSAKAEHYTIMGQTVTLRDRVERFFTEITLKKDTLLYYIKLIESSDDYHLEREHIVKERVSFITEDVLELIMKKLYELYDDRYHSIEMILVGNGIEIKRYDDTREYAKYLENLEYVELHPAVESAKLSLRGKLYVENKNKVETLNYENIQSASKDMNNKIDAVIAMLQKQNLGQEVIFNELQEMKEHYLNLNKKDWGQLLKGKLVDLGIAQVINKETAIYIFKELAQQVLRLS